MPKTSLNIGIFANFGSDKNFQIYDPFSKQTFTTLARPNKATFASSITLYYKEHFTHNFMLKFLSYSLRVALQIQTFEEIQKEALNDRNIVVELAEGVKLPSDIEVYIRN
jgi:hypothetical protein